MITNPEWLKPKEKPCFHQISFNCIEKLVDCIGGFNKAEIDADTSCQIEKQIPVDEFDAPEFLEFVIENYSELFGYIATGKVNIRIHKEDAIRWVNPPKSMLDKQDVVQGGYGMKTNLLVFYVLIFPF